MIKLNEFNVFVLAIVMAIPVCLFSCQPTAKDQESTENNQSVLNSELAYDWDSLFIKTNGWFGGDGIFGIPMDGKEFVPATDSTVTLFTFGDTMIGDHDGNVLKRGNYTMVNNSVGILVGNQPDSEKLDFFMDQDDGGDPKALFIPNTPKSEAGDYYWLGDGFVNVDADSSLYIFAYLIHEADTAGRGGFAFEQIGVNLISIPKGSNPPYHDQEQFTTPFFDMDTETSFGSAIYVNTKSAGAPNPDGYIYVYAVSKLKGIKGLIVARTLPENFTDFSSWRFWNGQDWDIDMKNSAMIAEFVSNEMSVSPLPNGEILLAYQFMTMGTDVVVQKGKSLTGPFEEKKIVWQTTENDRDKDYFTYNAKAYPHLSAPGEVLISYNVNSFDFWNDILTDPTLYRPRFVRWTIE